MEFHPADVLVSIINIAVLFILLRLILWKHIYRVLSSRSERVRAELEAAEKSRLDAEALLKKYNEMVDGIELRGRDLMRESQIKATEEAEEILKEAREKSRVMMSEAHDRIAEEKERAVSGAHHEIAQLATDMAARILKREVSFDDSKSAVDDFFKDS